MKQLTVTILFSTISVIYGGGGYFAQENVIPESGNVGIGTLNPTTKLDVHGRVNIDSFLVVKDSVTIQKNLRVEEDVRFLGQTRLKNTLIDNQLEVNGITRLNDNIWFSNLGFTNNLNNKDFIIIHGNGQVKKISYDSLKSEFSRDFLQLAYDKKECPVGAVLNPMWANGLNKIYSQCPQVNVGIGTSEPESRLDVRGTTFTNSLAINANPTTLGSKHFHLKVRNLSPSQQNAVVFLVENNERRLFQINNDGIVRAREVVIDLNTNWPDYVFNSDYSLVNYDDLRTYIASNGHLPNVPSAEEIKDNGIEVGAMNVVMMEKIEELTLYILELESRIKSLENKEESSSN